MLQQKVGIVRKPTSERKVEISMLKFQQISRITLKILNCYEKKKLLVGAFMFVSVFVLNSGTEEDGSTDRRPMFGSQVTGWGPC